MNTEPVHPDPSTPDWAALQRQAHAWVCEFATGKPTVADMARVKQWRGQSALHERAWTQACRDWKALGAHAEAFAEQRPDLARPRPRRMDRRVFLGAAASAFGTLAVVGMVRPPLGLWPSWQEWHSDYRTATGEQRKFTLANDIHLALNTQTSVAMRGQGEQPVFELVSGEAAMSATGASCEMLAGQGRVLLTRGEVEVRRLPGDQVRVRCTEGSTEVWHPTRRITLVAGQQVTYDPSSMDDRARPVPAVSAWRQGMVAFDDQPLSDVVDEINRYRPGRVVLMNDALARRRLSARVSVQALDEVVEHIERLYGASVRRVGDLVILS